MGVRPRLCREFSRTGRCYFLDKFGFYKFSHAVRPDHKRLGEISCEFLDELGACEWNEQQHSWVVKGSDAESSKPGGEGELFGALSLGEEEDDGDRPLFGLFPGKN